MTIPKVFNKIAVLNYLGKNQGEEFVDEFLIKKQQAIIKPGVKPLPSSTFSSKVISFSKLS